MKRKIIEFDEAKCDGCGLCVEACHEGAIALVDGKARLVSEVYCDGLGACIGDCPQGAITIVEREAQAFDEQAVAARQAPKSLPPAHAHAHAGGSCPGAAMRSLRPTTPAAPAGAQGPDAPSALANWPVQLHLVPPQAPYFRGATVLLAADCVPFAMAGFHERLLRGRTLLIGCPKLDDTSAYLEKLTAILRFNDLEALEVAIMEVPCCRGLLSLAQRAIEQSGKDVPLRVSVIGVSGELHTDRTTAARPGALAR